VSGHRKRSLQSKTKAASFGAAFLIGGSATFTPGRNEAWHGTKNELGRTELERYDRQRRLVTLEYIEKQSIQNKRNLESDGTEFKRSLTEIAADEKRTYDYLLRVSMIASLRRAEELG